MTLIWERDIPAGLTPHEYEAAGGKLARESYDALMRCGDPLTMRDYDVVLSVTLRPKSS